MRSLRFGNLLSFCFYFILLVGLSTARLLAQTTSTEILGLVTDASGAVVPGAKVTITRLATGETRAAQTNAAGEYSFPLIEIGDYNVRVELQGFRPQTVTRLHVELQQKARVNLTLEVGQLTESVEVSAQAVALKSEDAALGQVIENKRVIELPLNGRNVGSLALLVPGLQFASRVGFDGQGGFPIPGASVSLTANGQSVYNQNITLDGVDARESRGHAMTLTPSIEAIEEFKVQTSSYSAEYGMGGGAIVQISMKSGTNSLRGTFFEFLRNDKLDAETYFLNFELAPGAERKPKDRLRRNQFGAVVSGPVYVPGLYNGKNRTFWAFDFEGRRETRESVSTAWYPNQDFRNGDFSALLSPAINPATGKSFRAPIAVFDPLNGQPFPNNILPPSRIHPGSKNVMNQLLPLAQFQQADILDFTNRAAVPNVVNQNLYFWRIDHIFREADKVFVRYAADRSSWDQDYINPSFPYYVRAQSTNLASQWLHIFNPTMLNELRFGLNIANNDSFNMRSNTNFDLDTLGIGKFRVVGDNNRTLKPREAGVPSMGFTIGDRDGGNGWDAGATYQLNDNLAIIRGKHAFKMGLDYRYQDFDRAAANNARGVLSFGANESGFNFASLLLGYPNSASTAEGMPLTKPRTNRVGAYFLDEWKVTSRLTANIGLRWDYYGVPVDSVGGWRTLSFERTYTMPDGTKIPTLFPEKLGKNGAVKLWNQEDRFFMPRVGLAYRPANKWVVRTGGGWFSNMEQLQAFVPLSTNPPLSAALQFSSVTDAAQALTMMANGQTYTVQTRRFRPGSNVISLNDPFSGTNLVRPVNMQSIQPNHRASNHWQWSFDIQRELPLQTALTVGYVGSKSTNIRNGYDNWNDADPSPDTNFQARRPWQKFYDPAVPSAGVQDVGSIRVFDSYAAAWYQALQVTAEKRYSKGLALGLSYAYGKTLGEGEGGGNTPGYIQDPRNNRLGSKGRVSWDQRHMAVVHFVYEMPFAKNLHGVPGGFLKGWQVNGILSLRSGFPFNLTGADLNTGRTAETRPDRIADGRLFDQATRTRWFDTSAFGRTSCNIPGRLDLCHYGSAGYDVLESPGQRNLDFSLYKNFAIRENMKLQFRSEMFDATNTPFFGQPNGITFTTINSVVPDGPRDGEIRSLRTPLRIIQFGLKLFF